MGIKISRHVYIVILFIMLFIISFPTLLTNGVTITLNAVHDTGYISNSLLTALFYQMDQHKSFIEIPALSDPYAHAVPSHQVASSYDKVIQTNRGLVAEESLLRYQFIWP